MHVRLPSVRHPQSFYDVFGVAVIGVVIMAAVLSIWHGTFVRREMVVFIAIVFVWAVWAVDKILEYSTEEARYEQRH